MGHFQILKNDIYLSEIPKKPDHSIRSIIEKILPHAKKIQTKKNNKIKNDSKNNYCFFLTKGSLSVHRIDGLVVGIIYAPMCVGLITCYGQKNTYYMLPSIDAEVYCLDSEKVKDLLSAENLKEDALNVLAYNLAMFAYRDELIIHKEAYSIISNYLKILIGHNDRERLKVTKFIMDRSKLSRSTIMKILEQLRRGGYIEVTNGILTNIKKLPGKY